MTSIQNFHKFEFSFQYSNRYKISTQYSNVIFRKAHTLPLRNRRLITMAAPRAIFALSPARANSQQYIDYNTSAGAKLFNKVTAPLDYTFDVEQGSIQTFIESLKDRANMAGWNAENSDILSIGNFNLLEEYGVLTLEEIQADAANYIDTESRKAQNSYQMYVCIMGSLTDAGRAKLLTRSNLYTRDNVSSGPLLFKVLMMMATVDTVATISHIRLSLSNLDNYMSTIKDDIEKFNQYVRQQRQDLLARGQRSDDLLVNLFKGYLSCSDRSFTEYIHRKKDIYEEGGNVTVDTLMHDALNKYKNIKLEGKWNSLTPEQEKLLTLTAEFQELKDKNLKLSKGITNKSSNQKKSKKWNKNSSSNKKGKKKDFTWKKIPPKEGSKNTIEKDGKTYHWCSEHLAWCIHKPHECELKKEREDAAKKEKTEPKLESKSSTLEALEAILSQE